MPLPLSRRALLGLATGSLAAVGLTACGGPSHAAGATAGADHPAHREMAAPASIPATEAAVATPAVTIDTFSFMPAAIKVKAGTNVTWTNKDEEPHSVVSSEEPMRSPTLAGTSNAFSHTFAKPGTYHYNCGIHPFMHGTVEVTA